MQAACQRRFEIATAGDVRRQDILPDQQAGIAAVIVTSTRSGNYVYEPPRGA
jgi:hypothetical protein